MDKQDYLSWKENPVTEAFEAQMLEAMSREVNFLARHGGEDSSKDRYKVGVIQGISACVNWYPEFNEEGQDED